MRDVMFDVKLIYKFYLLRCTYGNVECLGFTSAFGSDINRKYEPGMMKTLTFLTPPPYQ